MKPIFADLQSDTSVTKKLVYLEVNKLRTDALRISSSIFVLQFVNAKETTKGSGVLRAPTRLHL